MTIDYKQVAQMLSKVYGNRRKRGELYLGAAIALCERMPALLRDIDSIALVNPKLATMLRETLGLK